MKEKNNVPWPYKENGQAFIGEGRGAPEAKIKPKTKENKATRKNLGEK